MKKIVIAADSFKGSISSQRFADVCESAIAVALPDCEVVKIPLGDGGEGTVDALTAAWSGKSVDVTVADPLLRPTVARYGVSTDGATAILEMAQASGLPLLAPDERNPLHTSTYGTGQMIADALARGCRNILIGIGGSATNDGGLGMMSALGARFYDADGHRVAEKGCGADLELIAKIDLSHLNPLLDDAKITAACDVDNPLCGQRGATRVFSRQKGADDSMAD
ncbi:MAG: glycerate kinase, partial [Muribaculaceae bacterium]|nr:glycerate kinase [Muribaculaceae bacterium]